jgi:hypothetical protein
MTEQKNTRIALVSLFIFAFAFHLYLFYSIGYTADDALITLRYAENLSHGKGFVYNDGERVLGTTTPLVTLLTAFLLKLGISGTLAFFLLNQIGNFCTAYFLYRIFQNTFPSLSLLPSILFLMNPETIQWSLSGMETQASIGLIFASIWCSTVDRWKLLFFLAALAVWTRIDNVALVVALTAVYAFRFRRLPLQALFIFFAALLPWLAFSLFYFGTPIPNSVMAKVLVDRVNYFPGVAEIFFRGFLHLHSLGLPFLLLAALGTWDICRRHRELLVIPIWTWGYALSYSLAAGAMHAWYYAPFYAGYLALNCAGLFYLMEMIALLKSTAFVRAAGLIAIVIVLYLSYLRVNEVRDTQVHLNGTNKAVGIWMKEHSAPETVFAVKDIGYIGYFSQRKILDLAGLVSPESIPFRARSDFLGPIRKFRPDYFAFSAGQIRALKLKNSGLLGDYEEAETIQNQTGSYTIYKLKKSDKGD